MVYRLVAQVYKRRVPNQLPRWLPVRSSSSLIPLSITILGCAFQWLMKWLWFVADPCPCSKMNHVRIGTVLFAKGSSGQTDDSCGMLVKGLSISLLFQRLSCAVRVKLERPLCYFYLYVCLLIRWCSANTGNMVLFYKYRIFIVNSIIWSKQQKIIYNPNKITMYRRPLWGLVLV